LRKNGRLVVGKIPTLRKEIIQLWHNSVIGGHSGIGHTYRRLAALFYWKVIKGDMEAYVKSYDTC